MNQTADFQFTEGLDDRGCWDVKGAGNVVRCAWLLLEELEDFGGHGVVGEAGYFCKCCGVGCDVEGFENVRGGGEGMSAFFYKVVTTGAGLAENRAGNSPNFAAIFGSQACGDERPAFESAFYDYGGG